MKIGSFFILTLGICLSALSLKAQTPPAPSAMNFTLNQAKDYALNNSPILLNSSRDVDIAKKQVWQSTSMGLPQANLSGSYSYSPQLAGLSDQLGEFIPDFNPEDLKTSLFATVQINQLIFSGEYIVGLKAAQVYQNLSVLANTKSKIGIIENITNNYFGVLIARQSKIVLDSTLTITNKTLFETEQMLKNGFVEQTDVDQIKILAANIKSSISVVDRQIDLLERLLKFQMGLSIDEAIVLTDNIDGLISLMNVEVSKPAFNIEQNIDYRLATTQEKLMALNLQLSKAQFLPSFSGYYSYYKNLDNNFFNDQSPNTFGLSLAFPLFSSGGRMSQVGQNQLKYLKAKTDKEMAADNLQIQYATAFSEYLSAYDIYLLQKDSRQLSEQIYRKAIVKFGEGVGSSLDLNQTQQQFFTSERSYFSAMLSLVSARAKLESLLTPAN